MLAEQVGQLKAVLMAECDEATMVRFPKKQKRKRLCGEIFAVCVSKRWMDGRC